MHDVIQQGVQTLASQNTATRDVTIFCATLLVYLLGLAWAVVVIYQRATLTVATLGRIVVLGVLAYLLSRVLTSIIIDPRPYIVAHTRPLIPLAHDNGFPSDHVLLAAFLAASLWWINRRLLPAFVGGMLLVLLGRLGVGAHHTLDVLGSIAIVGVAACVTLAIPLPAIGHKPLLPMVTRRERME
jgi:membrane-associated phospholipid phosphatase